MAVVNTLKGILYITTKWIISTLTLLSSKHRYYQIIIKKKILITKKNVNHAKESTVALVPFFFIIISDVTPARWSSKILNLSPDQSEINVIDWTSIFGVCSVFYYWNSSSEQA